MVAPLKVVFISSISDNFIIGYLTIIQVCIQITACQDLLSADLFYTNTALPIKGQGNTFRGGKCQNSVCLFSKKNMDSVKKEITVSKGIDFFPFIRDPFQKVCYVLDVLGTILQNNRKTLFSFRTM